MALLFGEKGTKFMSEVRYWWDRNLASRHRNQIVKMVVVDLYAFLFIDGETKKRSTTFQDSVVYDKRKTCSCLLESKAIERFRTGHGNSFSWKLKPQQLASTSHDFQWRTEANCCQLNFSQTEHSKGSITIHSHSSFTR